MKRPVIGIIIVICLQLGFTAYNAVDRPIESLIAVNEITSGTNPVVNMSDNLSDAELVISTQNSRVSKRTAQPILVSIKKDAKIPATTAINRFPQVIPIQTPLESVTITYPRPRAMPAVGRSENSQLSANAVPRSEKRSFVSKSVSVLKKPYDWIKALGSKIN